MAAIVRLRDILFGYYGSYDDIPAERQHEICKIIYKKLPLDNKFTDNFMNITKDKTRNNKKDSIPNMLCRMNLCLSEARQTVINASNMGGLRFDFETKITPDTLSSRNITQLFASYRTIPKRDSDVFPGLSKTVDTCQTSSTTAK